MLRENLVRFDGLPLVVRVPSLPELDAGHARAPGSSSALDLLERTVACTCRETLGRTGGGARPTAGH